MKTNIPVLTRRQMLKFGALTLSGFELLPMLRPFVVKASQKANPRGSADYCIFVFLQGGPSHIDSFDLKEGRWTPQDFDVCLWWIGTEQQLEAAARFCAEFRLHDVAVH